MELQKSVHLNNGLANGPKRCPSVKKHLFQIVSEQPQFQSDVHADIVSFVTSTSKYSMDDFKVKFISDNLVAIEFIKPKRIDREVIQFAGYQLVRKPYKSLYSHIAYTQLAVDALLGKE